MNASLMQNAYALHQAGRLAEAARIYDDVLGRELTHKDALYRLGLIHFQRRDFTSALAVFDRLIASHPNVADGYAARGAALSNLGRHTEALAAYDKAVALNPNQTTAWDHRGNALLEIGRAGDALQSYDRSIALKPDNAPAWRHRSIALLRLERPSEALASLNRAIALVPSDITALEQRGNLLMGFHRHAEAVADYDRVLANGRESADLFYNRANAHSILKNYDAAIRDSTRVLALEPDYPYARGVLVHSKLQCCDWGGLDVETAKISTALADGKPVISPFNLKALSNSPAEHLTCAQAWVDRECPPSAPL
jgi:protein O-GlcNAc transferase